MNGQFQKGKSGNPGGRPRVSDEVRELARSKAPHAFKRLVQLMDSKNERVAMAASNAVLDRAYGKPAPEQRMVSFQAVPIQSAKDITSALYNLLTATASGELSISDARDLAGIFETQRRALETHDLEERLQKLEGSEP
jgi:hypothetical protein